MKTEYPHLYNLEKVPLTSDDKFLYGSDKVLYGYEFLDPDDGITLYFQYFIDDEHYGLTDEEKNRKGYPKLAFSNKLIGQLKNMFGDGAYDIMTKWFEQVYNLPVKSVVRRDQGSLPKSFED